MENFRVIVHGAGTGGKKITPTVNSDKLPR